MNTYYTSDEKGNIKQIFDIETALKHVKDSYDEIVDENNRLRERITYLESENVKDKEIQKYKKEAERAREEARNGFPIPSYVYKKIQKWQAEHVLQKHCIAGREVGCGAAGGRFTWQFLPTGIGTLVTCKCNCGEEITEMMD